MITFARIAVGIIFGAFWLYVTLLHEGRSIEDHKLEQKELQYLHILQLWFTFSIFVIYMFILDL